jgi:hypothetical protein
MSVRAKFTLNSVKSTLQPQSHRDESGNYVTDPPVEMRTLSFSPVYANNDPSHENSKFWKQSPSGSLELGTINPEAWKQFELGKQYYLDFTLADS